MLINDSNDISFLNYSECGWKGRTIKMNATLAFVCRILLFKASLYTSVSSIQCFPKFVYGSLLVISFGTFQTSECCPFFKSFNLRTQSVSSLSFFVSLFLSFSPSLFLSLPPSLYTYIFSGYDNQNLCFAFFSLLPSLTPSKILHIKHFEKSRVCVQITKYPTLKYSQVRDQRYLQPRELGIRTIVVSLPLFVILSV